MIELLTQSEYTNLVLFVGILAGGELILIPAVYLALLGVIDTASLFIIGLLATLVGDSFWYLVGRVLPSKRLAKLPAVKKNKSFIKKFSHFFSNNGLKLLFYSKFVYGTRLVTQILFGIYKRNFFAYMLVNTLGVAAWMAFIFAVGAGINYGLDAFKTAIFGAQITFVVFVLVFVLIHIWIKRAAKRKWGINGGTDDEEEVAKDIDSLPTEAGEK